ncbi:MAG: hypothetical protein ACLFUS_02950 [Candidatus Sumerlaeia bacterium]
MGKKQPVAAAAETILRTAIDHNTDGPFVWSAKSGLDALQEEQ